MAIRRRMVRGKVTFAVLGIAVLVLMMGGSVFVSNQVTALRSDIARLQDRQDFLEAGSALLLTEWNQFRALDLVRLRGVMAGGGFADLRNVYSRAEAARAGFDYVGVGR